MNDLEEMINSLDFDNNRYFYHITSQGLGDATLNEGLFLENNLLNSTTIEIPIEMIQNPTLYCEKEYNNGNIKRQEMVIIGCEKGEEDYIVSKLPIPKWIENQNFEYAIPREFILGYINLESLDVTYNPECLFDYKEVIKCLKI